MLSNLRKKVIENWREILGWLIILVFVYLYLFKINNVGLLARRDKAFDFLVVSTVLVLGWLRINKRKI